MRDRVDLLARCLDSLTSKTSYAPYEIVVVDNDSQSEEARAYFSQFKHTAFALQRPFQFFRDQQLCRGADRQPVVALSEQRYRSN